MKIRGIVFVLRAPARDLGIVPDLMEVLWEEAFWTSFVSSGVVRSAIERRWRGAKGDVGGVAGEVLVERNRVAVREMVVVCGRRRVRVAMFAVDWW